MSFQIHCVIVLICLNVFPDIQATNDGRIIGGRPAQEGEFPYQVSLRRSFNDRHFCGGSVIGPRHILTAAHCMFYIWGGKLPAMTVSVVAGQNQLTMNPKSIFRNATVLNVHEHFNNDAKANDIAIVELDHPFSFDDEIVSIADIRKDRVKPGTKCVVSGWGVSNVEDLDPVENLLTTDVNVIDFKHCEHLYGKENVTLSPGMMCAGVPDGTKDACQGDSGGPLFCDGVLTGIVSTAIGCANAAFPGIYTEIAQYTSWINSVMYSKNLWNN